MKISQKEWERQARERDKKRKAILAKLGVSDIEYRVMTCPHYGEFVPPKRMACLTVSWHRSNTSHTADDYLVVIYRMIEKGWLRLQEKEPRKRSVKPGVVPTSAFDRAPPGTVVFTKEGYLLDRRIRLAEDGRKFVQQWDAFQWIQEKAKQIHYYAPTRRLCQEWIRAARGVTPDPTSISSWLGHPARIVRVRGPEKIGSWKPSTYLTHRSGYRAIVYYARLRRRRIRMPELSLDGTVEGFSPISIWGTIGGDSFSFTDSPGLIDKDVAFDWSFSVYGDPPEASPSGESHAASLRVSTTLYHLEEEGASRRRRMLTVAQAKEILASCARKYLDHRRKTQGQSNPSPSVD